MTKWVLLMSIVVVIAGFAVMVLWADVNQLLAGQGATINWPQTAIAALVLVLATGIFVLVTNRLALVARTHEPPGQ
jgi:hypothetical protein